MHTLLLLVLRRSHKSLACVSVARRSLRCRQRSAFESPSRSSRSRLCSSVFGTEEAGAGNMEMISHNTERKALP